MSPQNAARTFEVLATCPDTGARAAVLHTAHGQIETPVFMPVGTQATVKALLPGELHDIGARCILCNTYHLHLRPGEDLIRRAGGLHRFMNWPHAILTDSGGYQVFSLKELRHVDDEGVTFQSHLDGTTQHFTPEAVIAIQEALGADIIVPLDEPVGYPADRDAAQTAQERSDAWALRSLHAHQRRDQLLFAIVHGACFPDLRCASADALAARSFDGYCLGGLSVGEPKPDLWAMVALTVPRLPADRPRYLMGVGFPQELVTGIAHGIDMFDCVLPTRLARNGCGFSRREGRLNLKGAAFSADFSPLDPDCPCPTCRGFTRAYLRHLYNAREILAARLVTYHNVHFYIQVMRAAREAILAGTFAQFWEEWK